MILGFRRLSPAERLELLEAERARYNAIGEAIDAIVGGAVSATVSTAGGSRSFTRASLGELRALRAASARKYEQILHTLNGRARSRRIWCRWS